MEFDLLARSLAPFQTTPSGVGETASGANERRARGVVGREDRGVVSSRDAAPSGVVLALSERANALFAAAAGGSGSDRGEVEPDEGRDRTGELSEDEQREVRELAARDREVRAHENAHKAAAGQHARGGPSYSFERGPDGKRYAVGGQVSIDVSAVPNDPDATILKMRQVRRAALAPADPSPQDRKVASQASRTEASARSEKLEAQRDETGGEAGVDERSAGPTREEPASAGRRAGFAIYLGEASDRPRPGAALDLSA